MGSVTGLGWPAGNQRPPASGLGWPADPPQSAGRTRPAGAAGPEAQPGDRSSATDYGTAAPPVPGTSVSRPPPEPSAAGPHGQEEGLAEQGDDGRWQLLTSPSPPRTTAIDLRAEATVRPLPSSAVRAAAPLAAPSGSVGRGGEPIERWGGAGEGAGSDSSAGLAPQGRGRDPETGSAAATTSPPVAAGEAIPPEEASAPPHVSRETPATAEGEKCASSAPLLGAGDLGRLVPVPRPLRTRVLTVANQKGGVGKTTSTVNLAAALALLGARVLVLDLDPQGNASTALGVPHERGVPSLYDVLIGGTPLAEVVVPAAGLPGVECAPATIDLAGAEIELVPMVARETRLARALSAYQHQRGLSGAPRLDYVFIDCPPSLGLLTVNALTAAEELLIPVQCEYYALEGVGQLLSHIELIAGHLNPALHVSTVLLTMFDARTRLAAQVADEVRRHFGPLVLRTTIPRAVRISEAPSYGQTVLTYDPASSGALCYLAAARELAAREGAAAGEPGRRESAR